MAPRGSARKRYSEETQSSADEATTLLQPEVDEFLVEVTRFGKTRRIMWNAHEPLPLDHPETISLEKVGEQFVIRGAHSGQVVEEVRLGSSVDDSVDEPTLWLEESKLGVSIRRLNRPNAAFFPDAEDPRKMAMRGLKPEFFALSGADSSVLDFRSLGDSFVGKVAGKKVFTIKGGSGGFNLTSHANELTIEILGRGTSRVSGTVGLDIGAAANSVVRIGEYWWRFNIVGKPLPSTLTGMSVPEIDEETAKFNTLARKILTGLIALSMVLWMYPMPKEVLVNPPKEEKKPEIVELIKPKVIVELKPKPIETPKPKPTPKPPEPKPKPKPPEKKPKPVQKPQPKKLPKPPKPMPKPVPKPAPKPAPAPARHVPQPAKVDKITPKPAPARAQAVNPAPPQPKAPPAPTLEQVKAAQKAAAQAALSKSLGFLSAPSSKFAKTAPVFSGEPDPNAKYGKGSMAAAAAVKGSRNVLGGASGGMESSGPISTKNSRNVNTDTGLSGSYGSGKGLNDVQGKVALNQLYDPNGADMGNAMGGGSGMQMSGAGSISESAILKVLQKYQERFNYCYEKALLSHPTIAGNLVMQWTINPGGRSSDVRVARSGLNDTGLHNCMVRELGKITFPSPSGGPVTVKFPFAFSSSTL